MMYPNLLFPDVLYTGTKYKGLFLTPESVIKVYTAIEEEEGAEEEEAATERGGRGRREKRWRRRDEIMINIKIPLCH